MASFIWSPPLFLFLLCFGFYFSCRLGWLQIRLLPRGIKEAFRPAKTGVGDITPFQALTTSLAATVGTGNIVGVAGAIVFGGPGAVFWLWVASLLMMAIKYAEGVLAVKYRQRGKDGSFFGGPMYYMKYGLHMPKLAAFYSFCGFIASFGVGNMVQANSVAMAARTLWQVPALLPAIAVSFFAGLILLGGIKKIAGFSEKMVPLMAGFYMIAAIICLALQWQKLPAAFILILDNAFFGAEPVIGGFAGATVGAAMRFGIARGIFTNEAGLGNGSIADAAASTDCPARQGLVSMVGTFIDSLVVCSVTAFVILVSGLWQDMTIENFNGASLTAAAFDIALPQGLGIFVVSLGLMLFAFASIIGWAFYGQRFAAYLWGEKAVMPYNAAAIAFAFVGSLVCSHHVWLLSDCLNGFLLLPNLLALFLLRNVVIRESRLLSKD